TLCGGLRGLRGLSRDRVRHEQHGRRERGRCETIHQDLLLEISGTRPERHVPGPVRERNVLMSEAYHGDAGPDSVRRSLGWVPVAVQPVDRLLRRHTAIHAIEDLELVEHGTHERDTVP